MMHACALTNDTRMYTHIRYTHVNSHMIHACTLTYDTRMYTHI